MTNGVTDDGMVTCSRCGLASRLSGVFVWQRVSFTTRKRAICPACWEFRDQRRAVTSLIVAMAMIVVAGAGAVIAPQVRPFWVYLNLGVLSMLIVATIVPHELGHALAGRLMGISIVRIIIGRGRRLWCWETPLGTWELRAIPSGGMTIGVHHTRRFFHIRQAVFLLGGLVPSVAILWALWWYTADHLSFANLQRTLAWGEVLLIASAVVIIVNLAPRRVRTQFGVWETDGLQLAKLPWKRSDAVDEHIVRSHVAASGLASMDGRIDDATQWCLCGLALAPNDPLLRFELATVKLVDLQAEEAREVLVELLEQGELEPPIIPLLKNNIAWADFLIGTHDRLAEGRDLSLAALEESPWNPYLMSTHGSILLAQGELDEAVKLLSRALARHDLPRPKATVAAHLAIAEHRRGNPSVALDYLETAVALDSECRFLPTARNELQTSED